MDPPSWIIVPSAAKSVLLGSRRFKEIRITSLFKSKSSIKYVGSPSGSEGLRLREGRNALQQLN